MQTHTNQIPSWVEMKCKSNQMHIKFKLIQAETNQIQTKASWYCQVKIDDEEHH